MRTNDDLASIYQAAINLGEKIALTGSAGLAEHIAVHLTITHFKKQELNPIIIIAGSVSDVTKAQINYANEEEFVCAIDVDLRTLFTGREEEKKQRIIQ